MFPLLTVALFKKIPALSLPTILSHLSFSVTSVFSVEPLIIQKQNDNDEGGVTEEGQEVAGG